MLLRYGYQGIYVCVCERYSTGHKHGIWEGWDGGDNAGAGWWFFSFFFFEGGWGLVCMQVGMYIYIQYLTIKIKI
jgi:hypothetical protein